MVMQNINGKNIKHITIKDANIGIKFYNVNHGECNDNKIINCNIGINYLNSSRGSLLKHNGFYLNETDVNGDYTSVPYLGGIHSTTGGENAFKNNNVVTLPFSIWSDNTSQKILVNWNYFQINPLICPNVEMVHFLPYDPVPSLSISEEDGLFVEVMTPQLKKSVLSKYGKPEAGYDEMNKAYLLYVDEKNEEAEKVYRDIISKYPDNACAKGALVFLEDITERKEKDVMNFLNEIVTTYKGKDISKFAEYRKVYQLIKLEKYEEAARKAKESSIDRTDINFAPYKLYDLGMLYCLYMNKKEEGISYFTELINKYPKHILTKDVKSHIGSFKPKQEGEPSTPNDETITETKLFVNYPNPFNPSTVIKYQLSGASQVSLKVYDVMGREVATLVNSFQNKGSYDVTFNANSLASGIYFYKLNAGGKQFINKMLLMK